MIFPQSLRLGDKIRVIAPSGPFDFSLLQKGLSKMSDYSLTGLESLEAVHDGFLAAPDARRLELLQEALDCPHSRGILVARGGYGVARLIPRLSLDGFRENPKWLIGFSDATALHHQLQTAGFGSIHAANGTTLHRSDRIDDLALLRILNGKFEFAHHNLKTWKGGCAEGRLFGGNLTVLFTEAASGRLRLPPQSLLFLEDVTETSYRIDRMLDALIAGNHLSTVCGVVLGDFTDCSSGKFDVPTERVLIDNLQRLGVPMVTGFPAGHGSRNHPIPLGARARLDADERRLDIWAD